MNLGTFFLFLGLGFPENPLKAKKGTLFIPRLLPGLVNHGPSWHHTLNDVPDVGGMGSRA